MSRASSNAEGVMKRWKYPALVPGIALALACTADVPTAAFQHAEDATLTLADAVDPVVVPIDVKPEATGLTTTIVVRPRNRLAVALLVNDAIDVTLVDPATLALTVGDATVTPMHGARQRARPRSPAMTASTRTTRCTPVALSKMSPMTGSITTATAAMTTTRMAMAGCRPR